MYRLRIHKKLRHKTPETLAKEAELVECAECSETFKGKKRLRAHIENKHREPKVNYPCEYCGKSNQR